MDKFKTNIMTNNQLLRSFAGVILVNPEGEVLLKKEKKGWCLPGGDVALEEHPEEDVRREVYNELLYFPKVRFFGKYFWRGYEHYIFVSEFPLLDEKVFVKSRKKVQFLSEEELVKFPLTGNVRRVLKDFFKMWKKHSHVALLRRSA